MDPNAFSDGFARGLELRRLHEEEEAYEGADLDNKLRLLQEARDELRRVQEAVARRTP